MTGFWFQKALEVEKKLRDIIKSGLILCVISLTVALTLAFTYSATKDTIELRKLEKAEEARGLVMSYAESFEKVENLDLSSSMVKAVYNGIADGNVVGKVFEVEGSGYGGPIQITVGIDNEGRITGINIGDNTETPGLGQKITREDFLNQFKGISSEKSLKAVKNPSDKEEEIHIASGATVSSEAVVDAVQAAMDLNREIISGKGDL